MLKHFAFCYNNRCPVYKETKYNASYWPQKPESEQLRGIKKEDKPWELRQNPINTFSPKSARILIMQKYDKATSNTKNQ